jgi:phosphoserine phosphatase RsbU/P
MRGYASIRARMMAWVLSVTSLVLLSVVLWTYLSSRWRLEADMEANAVFLAEGAARQIDTQLGALQGVVNGMALALEAQQFEVPFDRVRRMQTACLASHPGIFGVCVAMEPALAPDGWVDLAAWVYREGDAIAYLDLGGPDHAHTREDWYVLPKYLSRPVWSEPYEWQGVLMVTYSVPLYRESDDGRQFVGVITCDLTLDWLEKMLADLPLGDDGYGLLMSRRGTFVSHPMAELVLNESIFSLAEERQDLAFRRIGQRMISGEPGIVPSFAGYATGALSWLAFTPLRTADWVMGSLISMEEMHTEVLRLTRRQAMLGMGGLFVLYLAVGFISRSITRPIRDLRDTADVLAAGNLDVDVPVTSSRDEVASLTRAFSDMRDNLKRHIADLQETTASRERMQSELRIAHDIQMGLVPKTFPPFPKRTDLDLYAVLEPAREVGGDFYDFFPLDEKRMVVAIGDVSGKGVPAALFMAVTRSFLRSAFRSDANVADVMARVNNELADGNDACMFVTLFCAIYHLDDGRLCYTNAGHNPPVILHPDGRVAWLQQPRGPVAGVVDDAVYDAGEATLPEEGSLVLYTDGVTEAMNHEGALYGEARMSACLQSGVGRESCRVLIADMVADIRNYADGAEQSDDITILVLKRIP